MWLKPEPRGHHQASSQLDGLSQPEAAATLWGGGTQEALMAGSGPNLPEHSPAE